MKHFQPFSFYWFNFLKEHFPSLLKKKKNTVQGNVKPYLTIYPFASSTESRFPATSTNIEYKIASWNNHVRTSLYHWWNFFFVNLFQQIIIPCNTYFICMAILQMLKPISDSGGIPTFLIPISFVLSVTMIKDAYEDIQRHRSDTIENTRMSHMVQTNGDLRDVECMTLRPGDLVKVYLTELIPADLVILTCADSYGVCHLETVQLDGETNLKGKTCIPEIHQFFFNYGNHTPIKHLEISYEVPTENLYNFCGTLKLYQKDVQSYCGRERNKECSTSLDERETRHGDLHFEYNLNINQFLWRGTTLSNTEWIIGIVVYTGTHSRIFKNSASRRLKYSQLLLTYNKHAITLAGIQFLLCLVSAIIYAKGNLSRQIKWYLNNDMENSIGNSLLNTLSSDINSAEITSAGLLGFLSSMGIAFGRFVLILSYFVPITLFVQLEIVKWFQAYFMFHDVNMTPTLPINQGSKNSSKPRVQTLSLMEDLGNITHVFTDKTGTLTLNLMQLRCFGIGCTLYGYEDKDDPLQSDTEDLNLSVVNTMRNSRSPYLNAENEHGIREKIQTFRYMPNRYVDFDAWRFLKHIDLALHTEKERIRYFLCALALCHSVLRKTSIQYKEYKIENSCTDKEKNQDLINKIHETCKTSLNAKHPSQQVERACENRRIRCLQVDSISQGDYDASSPDERALVCGASHIGLEFLNRPTLHTIELGFTNATVRHLMLTEEQLNYVESVQQWFEKERNQWIPLINHFPDVKKPFDDIDWMEYYNRSVSKEACITPCVTFDILEVFEFDNVRKKMSVLVRDGDGIFFLLTKGADNHMIQSAAPDQSGYIRNVLEEQLKDMAHEGYRTLVFGVRKLSEADVEELQERLAVARSSTLAESAITEVYNAFERNLMLVGCTGIEDKLQPEVSETIHGLSQAGIKTWVLTGDKLETAIAVGKSCCLLNDETYHFIINGTSEAHVSYQLQEYMSFIIAGQLTCTAFERLASRSLAQICNKDNDASLEFEDQRSFKSRDNDFQDHHDQKKPLTCFQCASRLTRRLPCGCTSTRTREFKTRKRGRAVPLTMAWNDFVRFLVQQAKKTPVIVEPNRNEQVQLTSQRLNVIIQHYFQASKFRLGSIPSGQTKREEINTAQDIAERYKRSVVPNDISMTSTMGVQKYKSVAMICTGEALHFILPNKNLKKYFFGSARMCSVVIACRVTPNQKADLVRQTSLYTPNVVSLAIGDGANDVGMITAANVGIGIAGQEGTQASRAADFSISEFRILRCMLFHHGHENLRRNSFQVYHTVYRNLLFGFADWLFGGFSMFTATDMYTTWLKQIFNVLFTPIPSLIFTISDRCLPADILMSCPWLYPIAQPKNLQRYYGNKRFVIWILYAFYSGLILVLIPAWAVHNGSVLNHGLTINDLSFFGHFIYWLVVITSNLIPVNFFHSWYWFTFAGYGFGFSMWFIALTLCSSGLSFCRELSSCLQAFDSSAVFHMTTLLVLFLVLMPAALILFIRTVFYPDMACVIRERIALGVFDVVVAPQGPGALSVVVPRQDEDQQWKGFAFSEDLTRLEYYRRLNALPKTVVTRTVALRSAAKNILQGVKSG